MSRKFKDYFMIYCMFAVMHEDEMNELHRLYTGKHIPELGDGTPNKAFEIVREMIKRDGLHPEDEEQQIWELREKIGPRDLSHFIRSKDEENEE